MHSFMPRRSFVFTSVALFLFSCSALLAEPVSLEQARDVTDAFLKARDVRARKGFEPFSIIAAGLTPAGFREVRDDDGTVLAYVADLAPQGFVATSADTQITPIIAYSFRNSFPADGDSDNPLYRLLKEDMKLRAEALAKYDRFRMTQDNTLWGLYAEADANDSVNGQFQQWPPENTTSTGGWLETTWDQMPPYNDFCPLDPVDANRCVVGCVATALAQLVNYHQQCRAQFDELDSYTTYSGIELDSDSNMYDFPSFEDLNEYLVALRRKYSGQADLNDTDVTALSFACGVATLMDYTSEGSGASPYDVPAALLGKFGFHSIDMTGGLSCEYNRVLQENIINGLPALLGIGPPDGFGGHFIVCDGYNTNGEYHLNFGWGSSSPDEITEAWYHLPVDIPSHGYIILEMLLNVRPVPPSIDVDPVPSIFYTAGGEESDSETLFIKNNTDQRMVINSISSPEGFLISRSDNEYSDYIESFEIPHPGQEALINVKFCPAEAGGYYGTLTIDHGEGRIRHVILKGCSFSGGTDIQAGEVFGTWSQAESPYWVHGDVNIPENKSLVIEPGVKVMFVGPYGMTIGENAKLVAEGNENSLIEFTAWNRDVGWRGLRFVDSGTDDILSYCSITYSKKSAGLITEYDYFAEDPSADSCGGAVYCGFSSPTITNCKIANNIADRGGAIYCNESYAVISNTVIANNASLGGSPQSGGICCAEWGAPEIRNCTIVSNFPGGIFTASWDGLYVTNTILWGNGRYQIQTYEAVPEVSFCNIEGGYPGRGNMDADPCFFDPSAGAGADYDGSAATWTLRSNSPCINSGTEAELPETDLAGSPRIYSDVVDLGAYENQSDLPLITILPSATVDANFVLVDANSTVGLEIANTGKIDFTVQSVSISDPNGVFSIVTPLEEHLLAPGESVQVEIKFAPTEEKIYTGTLLVNSTSSNAPQKPVTLRGVGVAGSVIPGGTVSGTWTKTGSPYTVTGDIRIPRGRRLTIEPGVVVKFAGHFGLTVGFNATLKAAGTKQERILFTPTDTNEGWFGIRFVNTGADDILKYCDIEHSKKPYTGGGDYPDLLGGAVLCYSSWEDEPGYLVPSSPTIDHCLIANSLAESGGGILCMDDSEAVITSNTIVDNSAEYDGGGIYMYSAYGTIANNVIAHNSAGIIAGGIINSMASASVINNTIVHNRPSGLHLEMAMWSWDAGPPAVLNNIIWQNEMYVSEDVWSDEYDIRFNDIQGGWEGDGNIDIDPCFADPQSRDYHLRSEAGRWDPQAESWVTDDVTSACIDAGDPDSDWIAEFWPRGEHINMGAFGGTSQASLSLSTVGQGGDLNNDDVVDAKDLIMLMNTWLTVDALLVEDITRDGVVNFRDFAVLAGDWIEEL